MQGARKKMKKIAFIILSILAVYAVTATAAAYVSSAMAFRDKFCPRTYIGDVDVSGMDAQNAEKAVFQGMSLKIKLRPEDGYEAINGPEIGYTCSLEPSVEELLKEQNNWLWWKGFSSPIHLEPKRTPQYNEDALIKAVDELKCLHVTAVAPQNAKIVKTETGFEIVPEEEGSQLDHEKVKAVILDAVKNGISQIDLIEEGCYCEPAVKKDDPSLKHTLDTLQSILGSTIRINMTGAEETLDKSVFFDWIQYENGSIALDEMELGKYTMDLEEKYKTFRTERDFRTHGRGVITVGGGQEDTYGFWLDREKTTPVIRDAILSGYSQTIEPVWKISAQTRNGINGDIGRTYVEVCIDEQRLWYYRNGVMAFETPVITGKNIDDTRTPTGVYRVLDCSASSVRISDSTALKSATWRQDSEFNLETYILNGGDKDVELPATAAAALFPYIETGTPVIIY